MGEPNENSMDYLSHEKTGNMSVENSTDQAILQTALELKASLAEFRKTVLNALEQKRSTHHIREPVWLNSREAGQMLRICGKTLRRYRNQNLIRYRVINRNYLYRYSELLHFLDNRYKLK